MSASHPKSDDPVGDALEDLRDELWGLLRGDCASCGATLDLAFLGKHAGSPTASDGAVLVVRIAPTFACLFATKGPGAEAPCPECFDRRSMMLRTEAEQWAWQCGAAAWNCLPPYLGPVAIAQIGLLARAALAAIANTPVSHVYTYDPLSQRIDVHDLLPDSFCSCHQVKDMPALQRRDLPLRATLKAAHGKNRMRALAGFDLPERALLNPVCGALGNCAIRGYQESVTAPIFGRYMQRYGDAAPRTVTWSGLTLRLRDSRVAGMMEAFERQAGQQPPPSGSAPITASYRTVAADALDPTLCFQYNDEAYRRHLGLTRFDPDMPLAWVWGYSLASRRPLLVPRQLAFYMPHAAGGEPRLLDNNSNGCATGSCYEEAILKGLLELIERDAFLITWYRKIALPRLDLSDFPDRNIALVLNRLDYLGFDIKLLDARYDIACPIVLAVARRRDAETGAFAVGASANPDPGEAIHGALFEAATAIVELPKLIAEQEAHLHELMADYSKMITVSDHQYLYGLPAMAATTRWLDASRVVTGWREAYAAAPSRFVSGDIGANLQRLVQDLGACGIGEVAVVDQTSREERRLGLKTVIVIAPGLMPLEFGHPRNRVEHLPRLYTAPARAGLAPDDTRALNDMPHPFP